MITPMKNILLIILFYSLSGNAQNYFHYNDSAGTQSFYNWIELEHSTYFPKDELSHLAERFNARNSDNLLFADWINNLHGSSRLQQFLLTDSILPSFDHNILSIENFGISKLWNILNQNDSNELYENTSLHILPVDNKNNFYLGNVSSEKNIPESSAPIETVYYTGYKETKEIIYKNKNEVGSFLFKDNVLTNNEGKTFPLAITFSSSSISPDISASPGNGASINYNGIYENTWAGSDKSIYARLSAPSVNKAASFMLTPSANASGDNQVGYFGIKTFSGNIFTVGTVTSSEATIGWENTIGSKLTLKADQIDIAGVSFQNGKVVSNTFEGTGALTISSYSSNQSIPSINMSIGGLNFISITDKSVLVNTDVEEPSSVFTLHSQSRGFLPPRQTTQEILKIKNPSLGLQVFNTSRRKLWFFNGVEWEEVYSRPVTIKPRFLSL
jgi:hypothetical protein